MAKKKSTKKYPKIQHKFARRMWLNADKSEIAFISVSSDIRNHGENNLYADIDMTIHDCHRDIHLDFGVYPSKKVTVGMVEKRLKKVDKIKTILSCVRRELSKALELQKILDEV